MSKKSRTKEPAEKRGRGRPTRVEGSASTKRIAIWVTEEELDVIRTKAFAAGMRLADYVRRKVLR